jgi:uncharacterized membrane protein
MTYSKEYKLYGGVLVMHRLYNDEYGFHMQGMMFMCIIFLAMAAVIIYLVIRQNQLKNKQIIKEKALLVNDGDKQVDTNKAIEMLNEKLVNGEINEEEYTRKKELILK